MARCIPHFPAQLCLRQWSHPAGHSHNLSSGSEFHLNSWYPGHVGECAGILPNSNGPLLLHMLPSRHICPRGPCDIFS